MLESGLSHKDSVSNTGEQTGEFNCVALQLLDAVREGSVPVGDLGAVLALAVLGDVEMGATDWAAGLDAGAFWPKENNDIRLLGGAAAGLAAVSLLWWKRAMSEV